MNKNVYEGVKIDVISVAEGDIITSSSAFDGDDDLISRWKG